MSAEERKLSVDGHVYRYGLVDGARCWYTGYSCKVAVDDETERLLAALSTAEREREAAEQERRTADEILSDEEIERRADTFNLDGDDWGAYVNHAKGYRDGLLASRAALIAARSALRDIWGKSENPDAGFRRNTIRNIRDIARKALAEVNDA